MRGTQRVITREQEEAEAGTSPASSWEVKVQAQGKHQGQGSSRCWSSVEGRVWILTNTEEEESLHTEELLGCDLKPPEFLGEVPHPDALAVHPGFVHAVPGRVRRDRWHRAQSV